MDAIGIVQGDIAARWRNGECGDETFADFIAQALHRERDAALEEAAKVAENWEASYGYLPTEYRKGIAAAIRAKSISIKEEP